MLAKTAIALLARYDLPAEPYGTGDYFTAVDRDQVRLIFQVGPTGHVRRVRIGTHFYPATRESIHNFICPALFRFTKVTIDGTEYSLAAGVNRNTLAPYVVVTYGTEQKVFDDLPAHVATMPPETLLDWLQDNGKIDLTR